MKTTISYLSLFLFLNIFTQGNTQNLHSFTGCVVDQNGQKLIYADIQIDAVKSIQTDVDGCYHFDYEKATAFAKISYPGYLQKEKTINSTQEQTIVLNYWQEALITPDSLIERERSGDYLLSGTVLKDDKKPLSGATVKLAGSAYGTITDIEGRFELYTSDSCNVLSFSYLYSEKKDITICSGNDKTEVTLKVIATAKTIETTLLGEMDLSEVVVKEKRASMTMKSMSPTDYAVKLSVSAPASPSPSPPPPPPVLIDAVGTAPEKIGEEGRFSDFEKGKDGDSEVLPNAGQLTAGEVNDFSKWDMWADISQEDLLEHRSVWQQYADHRYTLQLTTPEGLPVVNASVQLNDAQGNVMWRARTNNSGRAELWAHYFMETKRAASGFSITGTAGRMSFDIPNVTPFMDGINFYALKTDCNDQPVIDIAFVVDATGSMGDEITYLQAELLNVISRINDSLPEADIQSASVFYKDKTDDYMTKISDFSNDAERTVKFIQGQRAGGGGDFPEAVDAAMKAAVEELEWRDEATTRLLFLVLDAPPHEKKDNIKRMQVAVTKAATMGIQIIPVACSGINKSTEFLMRSMALATNGTYTFITNHSGIGNAHIEPSTDAYSVEFLNDVLVRLGVDRSRLQLCDEVPIAQIDTTPITIGGGDEGAKWSYYPNPTSGPLNFRFDNSGGMLYLSDAHGKLLQRVKTNESLELSLANYPAGNYWLRHEDASGEWTQGQVLLVRR